MLEHHAYLIRVSDVKPESIWTFVLSLNIAEVNQINVENFGIGDVRALTEKAYVRPVVGSKQLIVVLIKAITIEAQQALLKILEEPPTSTVFVFCLPHSLYLLPTLLSRFNEVKNFSSDQEVRRYEKFAEFRTLKLSDKILEISNRLAKKDIDWVEEMKSGLLDMLDKDSRKISSEKLPQFFWLAEHLQTRGASNKLLLEELALILE